MKKIGRTDEGNHLLEMTEDEYRALSYLQEVLSGRSFDFSCAFRLKVTDDMTEAFKAIVAFVEAGFKLNEMQEMVNDFKKVLFGEQK